MGAVMYAHMYTLYTVSTGRPQGTHEGQGFIIGGREGVVLKGSVQGFHEAQNDTKYRATLILYMANI